MNPAPHLALIGAGVAGLSCATALQQADPQVKVLDKSRGAGGRMRTRRVRGPRPNRPRQPGP
ncbi:NAD(P)-binding protein [Accumulibacter sp.]|uniref:NAD(P)-binding protein n=1 Tax=Accumulibacter sp. TaxID=2053492 RepID=UPI003DA8F1BC